ncbi:cell cycle checkpoint protein RAD17 isoform X2 [Amaranthus tricolor]|uniref:cell cycle checkpoint protein RAD17 isoform X2 n=1 Tax=Amaranthus tricolor TaxID=29722 RepID=UPI00258C4D48|nr:cell cycle checkpoint protein RAD17 isoform X2 [Amaranthus tricolor]
MLILLYYSAFEVILLRELGFLMLAVVFINYIVLGFEMGKRNSTVVLLSDDDDDFNYIRKSSSAKLKSNRSNSKSQSNSKSKRTSTSKTTTKTKKKARLSQPLSSSAELLSNFDESKFLSGGLAEEFAGFQVSTDYRRFEETVPWADKYTPLSVEELVVHKKKVEEVRRWFEEKLANTEQWLQSYVLLITGLAGTGKSATVRAVVSEFGANICEWNTPTPTIWQEHVHNLNAGMRYISKLDEFENFVERVRKYGMLSSSLTKPRQPMVLLIEDLPVANGRNAQGRLLNCLQLLVKSVKVPTVILITEYSASDSSDSAMRFWEEVSSSLESAGACKVAFPELSFFCWRVNSIKKVLSGICRQENYNTSCKLVNLIANACGGDIRHAIMTLQYACLKQDKMMLLSSEKLTSALEDETHYHGQMGTGCSLPFGRDQTLSLFHALGKFLHNKRDAECTMSQSEDGVSLKEEFARLPLKMDPPEKVLCQAYGQARPVAEFLHENVLEFLSKEAIEDAWTVTSYLSDVDCLLSSVHRTFARNNEAENIIQPAAASVAVRGVLFGNAHPSPSRWHVIRRPRLWEIERSTRRNMHEMERQRLEYCYSLHLSDVSTICTEYRPLHKWLGTRTSLSNKHTDFNSFIRDDQMDTVEFDHMNFQASEVSDDEIEEW